MMVGEVPRCLTVKTVVHHNAQHQYAHVMFSINMILYDLPHRSPIQTHTSTCTRFLLLRPPAIAAARGIAISLSSLQCTHYRGLQYRLRESFTRIPVYDNSD